MFYPSQTKRLFLALLSLLLLISTLLTGCDGESLPSSVAAMISSYETSLAENTNALAALPVIDGYAQEDVDDSWDMQRATFVHFEGLSATVSGSGASFKDGTLTITAAGTYVLSGTLADGQVVIDTNKNALVRVVLNGVSLSSSTSAPVYAMQARKTVVILAAGTENFVEDATDYIYTDDTDEPDAALFAKDDLSITGSGTLHVLGNFNNGIGTKDELRIANGDIHVQAANDGIRGRDALYVLGGNVNITAQNDGLKANNSEDAAKGFIEIRGGNFDITAGHDGIQAETGLRILDGRFTLRSGGGSAAAPIRQENFRGWNANTQTATEESESMKGMKAGVSLHIEGGTFIIDSEDDAVHSNGDMVILGGSFTISTGDDAFHADTSLRIEDGTIDVKQSYEGLESLAIDILGGSIVIVASDDGINSSGESASVMPGGGVPGGGMQGGNQPRFGITEGAYLRIAGGTVDITAANDGIDSNGNLLIEGGLLLLNGSSMGADGSIDLDGNFVLSGGEIITAGSVFSSSSASTQPLLRVSYFQQYPIGTLLTIKDADGNTLLEYTSKVAFSASGFSSPAFALGETYALYINDEKLLDITVASTTTSISSDGGAYSEGMGGMGGNRGGGWAGQGQIPQGGFPQGGMQGQLPEGEMGQFPRPGQGNLPEGAIPGQPLEGELGQFAPGNRGQRPEGEQPTGQVPAITQ